MGDYNLREVLRLAIEGRRCGEIARMLGVEARWVAVIVEEHRNLIAAKRYEREGQRPDGTPAPKERSKNDGK